MASGTVGQIHSCCNSFDSVKLHQRWIWPSASGSLGLDYKNFLYGGEGSTYRLNLEHKATAHHLSHAECCRHISTVLHALLWHYLFVAICKSMCWSMTALDLNHVSPQLPEMLSFYVPTRALQPAWSLLLLVPKVSIGLEAERISFLSLIEVKFREPQKGICP